MLGNAIRILKGRFQKKEYINRLENSSLIRTSKDQNDVISLITSEMRTFGYKVSQEKNFIRAEKNRFGTLGTSIFHLSIQIDGKVAATDIVYSNHLMTYGGYTFLGNVYGMAPLLILRNEDGSVISGSYVTASDTDDSKRYVAMFDIGDTGLEGGLMVYMTANLTSGNIVEGDVEQTPVLFLKIFDRETEIFDGKLGLNDAVQIDDKYLVFSDVKYWSNFYVVKDDGTLLVYAGFGLITLSLTIMFFIIPKRLWAEIISDEKTGVTEIYIGGRSDRFRSLYEEEYCSFIDHIKERFSNGTD
ncbi:MAG: cytochrome c biogenesis protein ResB [Euryarchaeota archaeon]|nr:cytochrome c biogenesis protein ResB [Euryarchaeota archaeon]